MPKKGYVKKRAHQRHCHKQAKAGLMNMADGKWEKLAVLKDDGMKLGYRGGYRV